MTPMLPLILSGQHNVLLYSLDIQLGSDWDPQTNAVEWSGNLAAVEARVVVVFV